MKALPSITKILVATDFSLAAMRAFRKALDLAIRLDAELFLLHAVSVPEKLYAGGPIMPAEEAGAPASLRDALEAIAQLARARGVRTGVLLVEGSPSAVIPKIVARERIAMVVLGSTVPHGVERLVFGSTAEAVFRHANRPVLVVGPHVRPHPKPGSAARPVVFATDFHETTTHAVRYAAALSRLLQAPLHCLHILPSSLAGGNPNRLIPHLMQAGLQRIAAESGPLPQQPVCEVAFGDEVSTAIADYAELHGAALVVLGVRRASLLAAHSPAKVTSRIVERSACPVLTIAYGPQGQSTPGWPVHEEAPVPAPGGLHPL